MVKLTKKVGPSYNKKEKRWYNANGIKLILGKGYYSKNINKYVMYGSDGSVTKYSPEDWKRKLLNDKSPIYNKKTKKWFNSRNQELNNPKGYYSKSGNLYTIYNKDGTTTKYRLGNNFSKPYKSIISGETFNSIDELKDYENKYNNDILFRYGVKGKLNGKRIVNSYYIPFIKDKVITLSNAGLATGAKLSTNLLDSLALHAKTVGLPVKTALGLATKESTLGNPTFDLTSRAKISKIDKSLLNKAKKMGRKDFTPVLEINEGGDVEPVILLNYHNTYSNPYQENITYALNRYKDIETVKKVLRESEGYADKKASELKNFPVRNILDAALEFYKYHPDKYNPGQSNYQQLVNMRANEVWRSPEIQEWYKNTKYK